MRRWVMFVALCAATSAGCRSSTSCAVFEDSAAGGERCTASWSECVDEQVREVVCSEGGRCECRVDGYTRRVFTRSRFCSLEGAESISELANRECDWDLRVGEPGLTLPF